MQPQKRQNQACRMTLVATNVQPDGLSPMDSAGWAQPDGLGSVPKTWGLYTCTSAELRLDL